MLKRTTALFTAVCELFGALLWRTMEVCRTVSLTAVRQSQTRTLTVGTSRGVIYDRDLQPLAPSDERLLAVVAPCAAAKESMTAAFGEKRAAQILQSGKPCLAQPLTPINTDFIRTFSVPVRAGAAALAKHLIGTVGSDGHGVSGAEKAFDALLSQNSGSLSARFSVDATGRVLPGLDKEILDQNYCSAAGVALTIDSELQRLIETALENSRIESGCALVMDAATGELLALANVPAPSYSAGASTAGAVSAPAANKALHAYSVGSVFKPLLAAFALENGVSRRFSYTCTGECQIGGTRFQCYGKTAHGKETMKEALENSCNTYFIHLMQKVDAVAFLAFCRSLGFGEVIGLCEGISCDGGSLPDARDLLLPGERANLAFGQGRLLASPVQLLSAYQVLATGTQTPPTVLCGTVNADGELQKEPAAAPVRRLSAATVKLLRSLLTASATAAGAADGSAAGKTGTAQSGVFVGGREVCRTWFAGFYPANAPRYIVAVLNEDGVSGAADCAPVFRALCAALQTS